MVVSTSDIALYGADLFIDKDGDIKLTPQDEFKIVQGIDTLTQAINTRLKSILAELSLHPNYGSELKTVIGNKSVISILSIVKQFVRKTLLQEPRIKVNGIKSISVYYPDSSDRTKLEIVIKVIPIDSTEELNIIYPYALE